MFLKLFLLLQFIAVPNFVYLQNYIDNFVLMKPKNKIYIQKNNVYNKKIVLEDWKTEIAKYICTKNWDCKTALAVAYAESGLNIEAESHTNDHGIFQINAYWQRNRIEGRNLYDVQENIDIAYEIYEEQGFVPWTTFKQNKYKKYMDITGSGSLIQ